MARRTTRTRTTTRKSGGLKQYILPAAIGGVLLWWLWPKGTPQGNGTNRNQIPDPNQNQNQNPNQIPDPNQNQNQTVAPVAIPASFRDAPILESRTLKNTNLRAAPSVNGAILETIPAGNSDVYVIEGTDRPGGWVAIVRDGQVQSDGPPEATVRGWVSRELLLVGATGLLPGQPRAAGYAYRNRVPARQASVAGYGWRYPRGR